jgi:hypothetical protein
MTIPEQIVAFLRGGRLGRSATIASKPDCNCRGRQEVVIVTLTLSLCNGFRRAQGNCASKSHNGRQEKLVVRAL